VTIAPESGPSHDRSVERRVAGLLAFVAITLAVASVLHLSGQVHGRSEPFDPTDAGIAEAIIGVVLGAGAVVMLRSPARGRAVGLATIVFAIVGFLVGLTITIEGGAAPDIAYHCTILPLLILSLILLWLSRPRVPAPKR